MRARPVVARPRHAGLTVPAPAQSVQAFLPHLLKGTVVRYELPGVSALNFVATRALGGEGLALA